VHFGFDAFVKQGDNALIHSIRVLSLVF
jgi:hypothetical protein